MEMIVLLGPRCGDIAWWGGPTRLDPRHGAETAQWRAASAELAISKQQSVLGMSIVYCIVYIQYIQDTRMAIRDGPRPILISSSSP